MAAHATKPKLTSLSGPLSGGRSAWPHGRTQ